MKTYLCIYRWSMQMKLHMALYTFVTIFLKAVCSLLQGVNSLPIMDIATMWLVSLVFAMIESAIYPENSSCTKGRTLAWAIVANLCFIGGAWMFGWFAELPLWGKDNPGCFPGNGAGNDVVRGSVCAENGQCPVDQRAETVSEKDLRFHKKDAASIRRCRGFFARSGTV